MSEGHAFCSPSDWEGWSNCPGKPAMEEGEPDQDSSYSRQGTDEHNWSALLLLNQNPEVPPISQDVVNLYVAKVRERVQAYELAGAKVSLHVEQKLPLLGVTGERNAFGTADCVIMAHFETHSLLEVRDAKFGAGVAVDVVDNGQLQIYALGALQKFGLLYDFQEIVLVIHQPRVREVPSEWSITKTALLEFGQEVRKAAAVALSLRGSAEALEALNPGTDQCRWCKAKYRCPALRNLVHTEVFGDFQDIDDPKAVPLDIEDRPPVTDPALLPHMLSLSMQRIPLIEQWCTAIRSRVETELMSGHDIPGFKLVIGRAGARAWVDEDAVVKLLLADGTSPDKILTPRKLLSPAQLDKPFGKTPIWKAIGEFIKQSEGKPSVAPADDPRPVYVVNAINDFVNHDGSDLV